jgi:hypothetical protein
MVNGIRPRKVQSESVVKGMFVFHISCMRLLYREYLKPLIMYSSIGTPKMNDMEIGCSCDYRLLSHFVRTDMPFPTSQSTLPRAPHSVAASALGVTRTLLVAGGAERILREKL